MFSSPINNKQLPYLVPVALFRLWLMGTIRLYALRPCLDRFEEPPNLYSRRTKGFNSPRFPTRDTEM